MGSSEFRTRYQPEVRGADTAVAGSVLGPAVPILTTPTSPFVAALFGKNQPHPVMDLFSVVLIAGKSDISF